MFSSNLEKSCDEIPDGKHHKPLCRRRVDRSKWKGIAFAKHMRCPDLVSGLECGSVGERLPDVCAGSGLSVHSLCK